MSSLTAENETFTLDALRAGDRADPLVHRFENRTLLDVDFDVGLDVVLTCSSPVELFDVDTVLGEDTW